MKPLRLRIAGFSPAVHCEDEALFSYIERELAAFKGGDGSFKVCVDLARDAGFSTITPAGFVRITPVGGLDVLVHSQTLGDSLNLSVRVHRTTDCRYDDDSLLHPLLVNMLFSLFFQQLRADERARICSIHACGAIDSNHAYLFAGASGVGKSTVARRILQNGSMRLLGDDMIPVTREGSVWTAHASPLGGDICRHLLTNQSAILRAVFFLSQGSRTVSQRISPTVAAIELFSVMVLARRLENSTPKKLSDYPADVLRELIQEAACLAEDVPCYRLTIELNDLRWQQKFLQKMGEENA